MISLKQIKAGRALLDWSQSRLAKQAGISLRALSKIESGEVTPRGNTLEYIQTALEKGGVEFLPAHGTRLREEVLDINIYEGEEAVRHSLMDMIEHTPEKGECVGISLNEREFFNRASNHFKVFYDEFSKKQFKERLLIREGDTFWITHKKHYQWLRHEFCTDVPFLVYGHTVQFFIWGTSVRLITIRNPTLAAAYRRQFETYWLRYSRPIPKEIKGTGPIKE